MALLLHRRCRQLPLGNSRLTDDLDLTLLTGFGGEAEYTEALLGAFQSRIALGAMPFEQADLAELKESPELLDELERIARRAEAVIGAFPRER